MRLLITAVGQKMPRWINDGYSEYQKRMPPHLKLETREIALPKRSRNANTQKLVQAESDALLDALPAHCLCVAMDVAGSKWSTPDLAKRLEDWQRDGRDVAFMIGGPDGLAPGLISSADLRWSLGPLTLPHPFVRVLLAEQLYRAWTITIGHPYHRE